MTEPGPCPACGSAASGRFCSSCGAALRAGKCGSCHKLLADGARYCHHCGAGVGGFSRNATPSLDATSAPTSAPSSVPSSAPTVPPAQSARALAWLVPGIAVLAVVAFLLGQRMGGFGEPAVDASATSAAAPFARDPMSLGDSRAPDISQMSPDERAARLFNRIMTYGAAGKLDSARMFAPMALQAYEMLGTLDAHNRYDMGMIAVVTGDVAVAAAEADTILKASPSHLLGLILAMKSAGLRQDAAARKALEKRFVAASGPERAKGLKEYAEHVSDIDAALKLSATSRP